MKLLNDNVLLQKLKEEAFDFADQITLLVSTAKPTSLCKVLDIDENSSMKDILMNADKVCVYEHDGVTLHNYDKTDEQYVVIKDSNILLSMNKQDEITMLGDRILTKVVNDKEDGDLIVNVEDKTKAEVLFSNSPEFEIGCIVAHPRFAGVEVSIPQIEGKLKIFHKKEILFIL